MLISDMNLRIYAHSLRENQVVLNSFLVSILQLCMTTSKDYYVDRSSCTRNIQFLIKECYEPPKSYCKAHLLLKAIYLTVDMMYYSFLFQYMTASYLHLKNLLFPSLIIYLVFWLFWNFHFMYNSYFQLLFRRTYPGVTFFVQPLVFQMQMKSQVMVRFWILKTTGRSSITQRVNQLIINVAFYAIL